MGEQTRSEQCDSQEVEMETKTDSEIRETLDEIQFKLAANEALLDFLVGLKLAGKDRERVGRIVKAADRARRYLPEGREGLSTYDAERATAYAAVAIAESFALILQRTASARSRS